MGLDAVVYFRFILHGFHDKGRTVHVENGYAVIRYGSAYAVVQPVAVA